MGIQIKDWLLGGADFAPFIVDGKSPDSKLGGLSKINLFVGQNNSGKSRFLRALAKVVEPRIVPVQDLTQINKVRESLINQIDQIIPRGELNGVRSLAQTIRQPILSVVVGRDEYSSISKLVQCLVDEMSGGFTSVDISYPRGIASQLKQLGEEIRPLFNDAVQQCPLPQKSERLYLPALRGLRRFQSEKNEQLGDIYGSQIVAEYFLDAHETQRPKVFTGLKMYDEMRKLLLGTLVQREVVERFEAFLSTSFFEGQSVAIIPREGGRSDVLYLKVGDEAEQPIYNLGDGVQMIIAITFPIFCSEDKPILVFIEEPELFLHPGLQRILVQQLGNFDNAQYFIATHSNHFLDLSQDRDDVSIFTVSKELEESGREKKAKTIIESASSLGHSLLHTLGVRNSSVFLTNCTIWVEGITDRRYIRRFLDLLQKHEGAANLFKEDIHYSFVEYGGGNITHWSFLDTTPDPIDVNRLCSKLFLVADADEPGKKGDRLKKLAETLKKRFYKLGAREIENLLSPETLKKTITEYEGSSVKLNVFSWGEYKDKPIGSFIEESVLVEKYRKSSYAADSGTVTNKVDFCDRALGYMKDFNDLTEEAKALAAAILKFIEENNPGVAFGKIGQSQCSQLKEYR